MSLLKRSIRSDVSDHSAGQVLAGLRREASDDLPYQSESRDDLSAIVDLYEFVASNTERARRISRLNFYFLFTLLPLSAVSLALLFIWKGGAEDGVVAPAITAMTGFFGTALGFYFGRASEDGGSENENALLLHALMILIGEFESRARDSSGGLDTDKRTVGQLLPKLRESGILNAGQIDEFRRALRVRNVAVHSSEAPPSLELAEAVRVMIDLVAVLAPPKDDGYRATRNSQV